MIKQMTSEYNDNVVYIKFQDKFKTQRNNKNILVLLIFSSNNNINRLGTSFTYIVINNSRPDFNDNK